MLSGAALRPATALADIPSEDVMLVSVKVEETVHNCTGYKDISMKPE